MAAAWKGALSFGLVSIPVAALEVVDQALVLTLMRYAEELVETSELKFPDSKHVRPKELEMARSLVESLSEKWKPDQYTDDYRANLMRIIRAKIKGKAPTVELDSEPRSAEVVDLMERLRNSLNAKTKTRTTGRSRQAVTTRKKKSRRQAA